MCSYGIHLWSPTLTLVASLIVVTCYKAYSIEASIELIRLADMCMHNALALYM